MPATQPALFAPAEAPTPPAGTTVFVFTWKSGAVRSVVDADSVSHDVNAAWRIAAPLGSERRFLEAIGVTVTVMSPAECATRFAGKVPPTLRGDTAIPTRCSEEAGRG